ncbi:MAG TPA: acyltransferase [Acidimicrobiia bacterium]
MTADRNDLDGSRDLTTLPPNVHLGHDCFVERKDSFARFRSERDPGVVLGDRVHVSTWTEFSLEPAGFVTVGDDSVLVGAIFMCAGDIRVGKRVLVSYQVTIADCDFHPIDAALRRADAIAIAPEGDRTRRPPLVTRPVVIGDDVRIGIGALILKGVTIGNGAQLLPGAVVTHDVPAGATITGNPARVVDDQIP